MDLHYKPLVFSVVVPINDQVKPYWIINCPFDFSKTKPVDIKDDQDKNCDYNIENKEDIKLTYDKDPKYIKADD